MAEEVKDVVVQAAPPMGEAKAETKEDEGKAEEATQIEVRGRKFKDVDELKSAFASLDETVGRQGAELGVLRTLSREKPAPETIEKAAFGLDDRVLEEWEQKFYASPKDAMKELLAKTAAEAVAEATTKVEMRQRETAVVESFWRGYFDMYENHRPIEDEVRYMAETKLVGRFDASMSKEERYRLIASAVDRRLEEVNGLRKSKEVTGTSRVEVGGGMTGGGRPVEKPAAKVSTFIEELSQARSGR